MRPVKLSYLQLKSKIPFFNSCMKWIIKYSVKSNKSFRFKRDSVLWQENANVQQGEICTGISTQNTFFYLCLCLFHKVEPRWNKLKDKHNFGSWPISYHTVSIRIVKTLHLCMVSKVVLITTVNTFCGYASTYACTYACAHPRIIVNQP